MSRPMPPATTARDAKLIRLKDGDTMLVDILHGLDPDEGPQERRTLRLLELNTPEKRNPTLDEGWEWQHWVQKWFDDHNAMVASPGVSPIPQRVANLREWPLRIQIMGVDINRRLLTWVWFRYTEECLNEAMILRGLERQPIHIQMEQLGARGLG